MLYFILDIRKNYCGLIYIINLRYRWGLFWFVRNLIIYLFRFIVRVLLVRDLIGIDFLVIGDKIFYRFFIFIEYSLFKNRIGIKDNLLYIIYKIKINVI